MQRHHASLPGWVQEMVDTEDWKFWRRRVAEYQFAHRPHGKRDATHD